MLYLYLNNLNRLMPTTRIHYYCFEFQYFLNRYMISLSTNSECAIRINFKLSKLNRIFSEVKICHYFIFIVKELFLAFNTFQISSRILKTVLLLYRVMYK